jgi:hypothetical protein
LALALQRLTFQSRPAFILTDSSPVSYKSTSNTSYLLPRSALPDAPLGKTPDALIRDAASQINVGLAQITTATEATQLLQQKLLFELLKACDLVEQPAQSFLVSHP